MRIVELTDESKNNILENLLKRSPDSYGKFESAVAEILLNIKTKGDEALFEYTKNFDKADINADNIVVTEAEIEEAYSLVDPELIEVIRKAIVNIRSFHEKQKQYSWFDYIRPEGYCTCKSRCVCTRRKGCLSFISSYECSSSKGCRC